jgi:hypothetical protein
MIQTDATEAWPFLIMTGALNIATDVFVFFLHHEMNLV